MSNDFNPRPPRGERQESSCRSHGTEWHFNPRPPRGERRHIILAVLRLVEQFQSTPPARGATNPSYRGELTNHISIHAPREGSDGKTDRGRFGEKNFNPRPPRGERLIRRNIQAINSNFNPRPPRGERHVQ